jgi:hypothetical protein
MELKCCWKWDEFPVCNKLKRGDIRPFTALAHNLFDDIDERIADHITESMIERTPWLLESDIYSNDYISHTLFSLFINVADETIYKCDINFDVIEWLRQNKSQIQNRLNYIIRRMGEAENINQLYYIKEYNWFDEPKLKYVNKSRDIDKPDFKFIHELSVCELSCIRMSDEFIKRLDHIKNQLMEMDFVNDVKFDDREISVHCDGIDECEDEGDCDTISIPPHHIIFDVVDLPTIVSDVDMVDWWDMDMISPHPNIREDDGAVCYGNSDWIKCQWIDSYNIVEYVMNIRLFMMRWNSDDAYFNPVDIDICADCPYNKCMNELCRCCDCDYKNTSECHNCSEKYEYIFSMFIQPFIDCDSAYLSIENIIEDRNISDELIEEYASVIKRIIDYFDDVYCEKIDFSYSTPFESLGRHEIDGYYEVDDVMDIYETMMDFASELNYVLDEIEGYYD